MVVTVEEQNSFFFAFGGTLDFVTALQGSTRPVTVVPLDNKANGISGSFRFGALNLGGNNQSLTLGVERGEQTFGLDLDYLDILPAVKRTGILNSDNTSHQ